MRDAVTALGIFPGAAILVLVFRKLYELANKKIELAIVVVVEPDGARRPPRRRDSCLLGHIGERAIAVIVIKNVAPVLGHVKIGKAVPVIVADRNPLPI